MGKTTVGTRMIRYDKETRETPEFGNAILRVVALQSSIVILVILHQTRNEVADLHFLDRAAAENGRCCDRCHCPMRGLRWRVRRPWSRRRKNAQGSWRVVLSSYVWLDMALRCSKHIHGYKSDSLQVSGCGWCESATNPISLILLTSVGLFSSFARPWKKVTCTLDLSRRWRGENADNIEAKKERKTERERETERQREKKEKKERDSQRERERERKKRWKKKLKREKRETEGQKAERKWENIRDREETIIGINQVYRCAAHLGNTYQLAGQE